MCLALLLPLQYAIEPHAVPSQPGVAGTAPPPPLCAEGRDAQERLSTFEPLHSWAGEKRFIWKHKLLKGALQLSIPSGEVRCCGTEDQQSRLMDLLRPHTEEWDQPLEIPKVWMSVVPESLHVHLAHP